MNKKDIMILSTQAGFNPEQTWITFIPYNYGSMYSKTDKFNGLKMFTLEKNRFKIDYPLYKELEITDILAKCTLEYELQDVGTLNPILKPTKLVIENSKGNKVFDLVAKKRGA